MPQKRRDYGTGSIYQRGDDGRWVGSIRLTSKRVLLYAHTREEAEYKLREYIKTWRLVPGRRPTYRELEAENKVLRAALDILNR